MKGSIGINFLVPIIASEAEKEQAIYEKASIPCVTKKKRIIVTIKDYSQAFRGIMKSYQSRKNSAAFQIILEKFQNDSKKLFDFAFCKCKDMSNCNCAKEFKISVLERVFHK